MITDIVLLATVGIRCVLVHGGGPEINIWLEKVGITPEFKNGLRVTDGTSSSWHPCVCQCLPLKLAHTDGHRSLRAACLLSLKSPCIYLAFAGTLKTL